MQSDYHRVTGDQNGESGIISTGATDAVSALGPRSTAGTVSSVVMISLFYVKDGKICKLVIYKDNADHNICTFNQFVTMKKD